MELMDASGARWEINCCSVVGFGYNVGLVREKSLSIDLFLGDKRQVEFAIESMFRGV